MSEASSSLAAQLRDAPRLTRPDLARDRVEAWRAGLDPRHAIGFAAPEVDALLLGLADHSPYLWRLVVADDARLSAMLAEAPEQHLERCLETMDQRCDSPAIPVADVMQALRQAKASVALLVALADLGGVWSVEAVTAALTQFADRAVSAAIRVLLREAHRSGKLVLADVDRPEIGCGIVILALGKQGSRELNYSSDIDIVAFFDPDTPTLAAKTVAAPFYVKLVQSLARILSERTGDGYVVRVDLRLRPDPGSTAVALGLSSAFSYYERYGQNWERAALIKARPVAGDTSLGDAFLRDLSPFIWRKYFDYAAIADIHAMKRQIHAVRGHSEIAVAGHDVKLGRGGIREIEFFVQTQQLIFGGRRPALRGARTLDMLAELHRDGWVDADAVEDLSAAYRFLRTIEHRLQMIADEQTQRLPSDPLALAAFANFAGFDDVADFAATFVAHAQAVERHYAKLFEHAPALDAEAGSLVFTGVEDDPETLETLRGLGFLRPAQAAEAVRGWHFGRRAAVQSPRAREVLTDLVPRLLIAFSRSGDPDAALMAFDKALARMPAAIELFSMLRENAALLDLFGDILGVAPRLAAAVATRPHVLDAAIDPASLQTAGDPVRLEARAKTVLDPDLPDEEFLDRTRDFAQEELFLIGVRLLSAIDDPATSGLAYSDLAAIVVRATLAHCQATFEREHGVVPGGACAVVALGKLGSREMTAGSDLDLMLIYDFDPDHADSTGPRPLDALRYYARLTQRLIAALTVATRRGRLYDVDMRLRPSGGKGPLATQLRSFVHYQAHEAQTWEHMTLTRARVIAGDSALSAKVEAAIATVLTSRRDAAALRVSVREMRALVAREKGEDDPWDLKLAAGGLIDLDFMAQYIVLRDAADHPSLLLRSTRAILAETSRLDLLDHGAASALIEAHRLYTNLLQIIRLTVEGSFDPATSGIGVRRRIVQASELPDFQLLDAVRARCAAAVRATFVTMLGAL
ncbi:bifunctional [glutamine synthetase] adenylyltransferase/[glutamine synthetase]-adenylyl-L-tyrosine phosphorylase [Lichenihabitans psoromatis]|uniref:bifunctional [glutamine synthetase] adenylyltransferase/[glutamine synthetase]-adenylyl-L-tyrosine phosphorylase n=1 Tax=Lichenihabitans psoromatis TaxID=2528642 RepID=UPI001036701A|nr:bifunctional [glutamine synthetase] adenylyltransferase/[glutamine synthetase]-adenylyl-L-tyrosine phosphorylase [Lichenihabitans psoromatis]